MKILGTLIFAIGALIAMILLGFSVWAEKAQSVQKSRIHSTEKQLKKLMRL
jgi:hypothetical protein